MSRAALSGAALLALTMMAPMARPAAAQFMSIGPCEKFSAPMALPVGQVVTRRGNVRIRMDSRFRVAIPVAGTTVAGRVIPARPGTVVATVFAGFGDAYYLTMPVGRTATLLADGGDLYPFAAGELLSDFPVPNDALRKSECVRIGVMPVMVSPAKARRMGYRVVSGQSPPRSGAPYTADPPPPEAAEKPLSDLFAGSPETPETGGGLATALARDVPDDGGGSELSTLFAADPKVGKPAPREPEIPDPDSVRAGVQAALDTIREGERPVSPPVNESAGAVCFGGTGAREALLSPVPVSGFAIAGRLSATGPVPAYRRIPFTEEIVPDPVRVRVGDAAKGRLVPLAQPFGYRPHAVAGGAPVRAVRPLDVSSLQFDSPAPAPLPAVEAIRLLVVSDAATLAVSGLDRLETRLTDWAGRRMWAVSWAEITAGGEVLAPVDYPGFAALVASVSGRDDSYAAVNKAQFSGLMRGIERVLTGDGAPFDKVFWLIEGHPLPHNAPARFEAMIETVNRAGTVSRRGDGSPRKWLEVIAGQYSTPFSQYYLQGPILTTGAGYMSVERRMGAERDRILTNTKAIEDRLHLALNRAGGVSAPVTPGASRPAALGTDGLIFDRDGLLGESGLLVARASFPELLKSLSMTTLVWNRIDNGLETEIPPDVIDALSILALRTREDGSLSTRRLSAQGLMRRLSVARARPGGEAELTVIRAWLLTAMSRVLAVRDAGGCDYLFLADTGL